MVQQHTVMDLRYWLRTLATLHASWLRVILTGSFAQPKVEICRHGERAKT